MHVLIFLLAWLAPSPSHVWINEIHHTNAGPDRDEGVEIAGRAGTDLSGWHLWFYSGLGTLYGVYGPGTASFQSLALSQTIDDEAGGASGQPGLGAVWVPLRGLRSGCNGVALTDAGDALVQFVSTGGCRFNALDGPVYDLALAAGGAPPHPDALTWSTAIQGPPRDGPRRRVQEWTSMPAGYSLQLTGAGDTSADFAWGGPYPATPGRLGDYQAPAAAPNPTSNWAAGDAVGTALSAPTGGPDRAEDAGGEDARTVDAGSTAAPLPQTDRLTVGLPSPNPATRTVRFVVSVPADAQIQVLDALGRRARTQILARGARHASVDVSGLAAGAYAVRFSTDSPRATTPHATVVRRFTVAR